MHCSYAILIDAGFVRYKLGSARTPADAVSIGTFAEQVTSLSCLTGMHLHRIYFYDAKPLELVSTIPLSGGVIDFGASATARRNKRLHAALQRRPFFALRIGELLHGGWRLRKRVLQMTDPVIQIGAEDLEPDIRQKGVDMRIGLDIASLTLKHHVQVIVLVTADSDFVPAMKFARREGAQLFLVTLGHGINDDMREHADLVIDWFPLFAGHRRNLPPKVRAVASMPDESKVGRIKALRTYAVVIEDTGTNFSAYVPDLPGCVATGSTVAETEKTVREAIALHRHYL